MEVANKIFFVANEFFQTLTENLSSKEEKFKWFMVSGESKIYNVRMWYFFILGFNVTHWCRF